MVTKPKELAVDEIRKAPFDYGVSDVLMPMYSRDTRPGLGNDGEPDDCHDGLIVTSKDNRYGYMKPDGTLSTEAKFDRASSFSEGLALVFVGNKAGFIDKTGHFVVPPQYAKARDFSEGLAAVSKTGEKWGYIDHSGKLVIPDIYLEAEPFSDGLAKVGLAAD